MPIWNNKLNLKLQLGTQEIKQPFNRLMVEMLHRKDVKSHNLP